MRLSRRLLHVAFILCAAAVAARSASAEKPHLLLGCEVLPGTVHAGEPVTVTGAPLYLDSKRPVSYIWQTTGGRLGSAAERADINTSGLAPGDYTITGHLVQGTKPEQQATCTARFKVVPFEPPNVSCTPTPTTGPTGSTFDIRSTAFSAQNRPLSYAFSTSAGRLATTGVMAKLSTKDVPPGTVKITCYVVDDRGLSASATTQITLSSQLQATTGGTRRMCSLSFARDRQHPVRVDALDETCLDSVAFAMKQETGAKLMIVGNASPDEAPEAAAERSMNARQYLAVRGIPPSRIEVRVGETSGPTANITLVPAGAVFDGTNSSTFDERQIVLHGAPYVPVKPPAGGPRH